MLYRFYTHVILTCKISFHIAGIQYQPQDHIYLDILRKINSMRTEKLTRYLESQIDGFTGPVKATKFSNGQSNPTYLLNASSGQYVLRRQPEGELLKSAHAVDREFRVINALRHSEVPVANAYHLCESRDIIGTMFFVMEYVDGRIFWDPALPELKPYQRNLLYEEMARVLSALHQIDISAVGLEGFGNAGNYFQRQLGRWTRQYESTETQSIVEMNTLIKWLNANLIEDDGQACLVHGDFRLDNLVFNFANLRCQAILDWELSTIGHPYSDIAYQCMQLRMKDTGIIPGLGKKDRTALGIPDENQYVELYCKHANISEIPNWPFYLAFSFFRFAAILQGVKKRALMGNASSTRATQLGELVQPLATMALDMLTTENRI